MSTFIIGAAALIVILAVVAFLLIRSESEMFAKSTLEDDFGPAFGPAPVRQSAFNIQPAAKTPARHSHGFHRTRPH